MTRAAASPERAPLVVGLVGTVCALWLALAVALYLLIGAGNDRILGDGYRNTSCLVLSAATPAPVFPAPLEAPGRYAVYAALCPLEAARQAIVASGHTLRRDDIAHWFCIVVGVALVASLRERRARMVWVTRAIALGLGCTVFPAAFVPLVVAWNRPSVREWYFARRVRPTARPVRWHA